MITYHHNGECWYKRNWSIFHWIRNWFIWVGGWEKANGKGWQFRIEYSSGNKGWMSPTPIAMFGHRIVIFNFFHPWVDIRLKRFRGILVFNMRKKLKCYISKDGTPSAAHIWLWNTPSEVKEEARIEREKKEEYFRPKEALGL